MKILSILVATFSLNAFAGELPSSLNEKVYAAAQNACVFNNVRVLATTSYREREQGIIDTFYTTILEASYYYDYHPHVGNITVKSALYHDGTEEILSVESDSVGLCQR